MPLRLKLPTGDKLILNGAVIENQGSGTVLILHNRADILRRKEIMQESEAVTPALRIYFALQCAYIFSQKRADYIELAGELMRQYNDAAPSSLEILQKISKHLKDQRYYDALKVSRELIEHENHRLESVKGAMASAMKEVNLPFKDDDEQKTSKQKVSKTGSSGAAKKALLSDSKAGSKSKASGTSKKTM